MTYSFLPQAETEYLEAIAYYEIIQAGLGESLIAELEKAVDLMIDHPLSWPVIHAGEIRRIRLARFPYAIFYRILPNQSLQITAFAHRRRRPGYWVSRLEP